MDNFKLIVFSHPSSIKNEAKIINDLFDMELELFHLRKPEWSLKRCRKLLQKISTKHHNKIVLHQHYELTREFELKGIHIKSNSSIAQFKQNYNVVSTSCHSFIELFKKNQYEYVFISPIFDSISKRNYTAKFTMEELQEAHFIGMIDSKVIALGGITPQNIPLAKQIGFGGVAALGYLWEGTSVL